jgi:hypothetical protein
MNYPNFIDPEMRELLGAMSKAVVPRKKRKTVVRINWHTPCYSHSRFKTL